MVDRPAKRGERLDKLESRAVCRDGMSGESYEKLEAAESVDELKAVLLEVFEPSSER